MARRKSRRSGFGWSEGRHEGAARDMVDQANHHIGKALRGIEVGLNPGACSVALDELIAAADSLGGAASHLNAAEIAPGESKRWMYAYSSFGRARKILKAECLKR